MTLQPHPWEDYDKTKPPPTEGLWDVEYEDGTKDWGSPKKIDWSQVKRWRYGGL